MLRSWIFHPLIFYPLVIALAALLIAFGLQPQNWTREPAPVAAELVESELVYAGEAFNSPDSSPEQYMTVVRDFFGRAQSLRIAVKPDRPPPAPAEQGVRILLTPEDAVRIGDRPVTVEVTYNPSAVNAATGLAISLQGIGPAQWVSQSIAPEPATVRFDLPPQQAVDAIGIRALSQSNDQAYGVEITRVRVTPRA